MRSACTSSSAWGSTWRPLGVRRGRRRPSGGLAIISEFEWVVVGIPVHWQSLGGARNTLIIIQRLKISIDGGKDFYSPAGRRHPVIDKLEYLMALARERHFGR